MLSQNYKNIEFLIRDQSPNFEAYEFVKKELPEIFAQLNIQKGSNRLHSGGHNDLINQMTGDLYICASNDMLYPKNFVSQIVEALEKPENEKYGTATVKLINWNFQSITNYQLQITNEGPERSKTNVIDSCGIALTASHWFFDLGQTEEDKGQYDSLKDIFGASGALAIFRKSALDAIKFKNKLNKYEYFDELLHYKNDVDLAYRLQWAGQKCLFLSQIKVFHDRQVKSAATGFFGALKSRDEKNNWTKESSYFGQKVLMMKNYSSNFSFSVRFKTWLFNFFSQIYIFIFEHFLFAQNKKIEEKMPEILEKKNAMKKVVDEKEIEKFMR